MSTKSLEEPRRLAPSQDTLRQLFAFSGNLCAFPGCSHLLINEKGEFVAQIAHIEGVKGERFNPSMDNDQRRHPSNLVLLCYKHHVETDDEKVWTVKKMRKLKEGHERRFKNPEKAILAGLKDWTQSDELVLPANIDGIVSALALPLEGEDKERYLGTIQAYLQKYKNVPHDTRAFLGAVVLRMETLEANGLTDYQIHSCHIPYEDMRNAHGLSQAKMRRECEALERYGLGGVAEGFEGFTVFVRHLDGAAFWNEVLSYCRKMGHDFRMYYLDLNFSGLGKEQPLTAQKGDQKGGGGN